MNAIFIEPVKKFIGFLFVTLVSFLGCHENEFTVNNTNKNKSLDLVTNVVEFQTETKYNHTLDKGVENVLVEGENGYAIVNTDTKETVKEKNPVNKVIEVGTKEEEKIPESNIPVVSVPVGSADTIESFTGKMTAYGGDCCGGSGGVAYVKHNLLTQGIYYNDNTYGSVRILSAAPQKFTPGTIVEVIVDGTNFYAIVLDWGGDMKAAWNRGSVWMDLAFKTQSEAMQYGTRNNVTFNVKRYGW